MMAVMRANNSSQDYFRTVVGESEIADVERQHAAASLRQAEAQYRAEAAKVTVHNKPVLLNGKPFKDGKDW